MIHETTHTHAAPHVVAASPRRISWGAVIAGCFVALACHIVLSLLGMGIGLGTVHPATEYDTFEGLGTGAAIWWSLSMLIALFLGGLVAARLAGIPRKADGSLHGLITFCVVTILSIYLLTSAVGSLISGATRVVGAGMNMAGQGIAAVAPQAGQAIQDQLQTYDIDLSNLKQEAEQLLRQTGQPELQPEALEQRVDAAQNQAANAATTAAQNPRQAGQQAESIIDTLFREGSEVVNEVDREAAVNVVMQRTGQTREQAQQTVDGWIQTYQQARATATETAATVKQESLEAAEATASAISSASLWAFFGLVLSAIAAAVGGMVGTPKTLTPTHRDSHEHHEHRHAGVTSTHADYPGSTTTASTTGTPRSDNPR